MSIQSSESKLTFTKLNTLNTIVEKHTKYIDDLTTSLETKFTSVDKNQEQHDVQIKTLQVAVDIIKSDHAALKHQLDQILEALA